MIDQNKWVKQESTWGTFYAQAEEVKPVKKTVKKVVKKAPAKKVAKKTTKKAATKKK